LYFFGKNVLKRENAINYIYSCVFASMLRVMVGVRMKYEYDLAKNSVLI